MAVTPTIEQLQRGERNTWASEEKSGGRQAEARYKGYLKVRGKEEVVTQREGVQPPKK